MNTSYELKKNNQSLNLNRISSTDDALAVFSTLTLKEKCQYLIKISKRNTCYQTLVLLGLTLLVVALDYLASILV